MKKLYTLVALATFFFQSVSAQYTGGVYTAVRNGNWHTTSGPNVWDPNGEPPVACNNCEVIINAGVSVTLNTSVTMSNSSLLRIGDGGTGATLLSIGNSGGSDFTTSNNIILVNDGSSPANGLVLVTSSAFINSSSAGTFDGIFTSTVFSVTPPLTTYAKMFGNAPSVFNNTTVVSNAPPPYTALQVGPKTLNSGGILPIILSDFNASLGNEGVNLDWKTQLEQNASHFTVQRNSGNGWSEIGKVTAKGNSATAVSYSFTDATPAAGVDQYRLVLVDLDGKFTYSEVKVIHTNVISSVGVFPNPAHDYVNVNLGPNSVANLSIKLFNQGGQLLFEKQVNNTGGTIINIPVALYPTGNYLIMVTTPDGSRQTSKLFISK